MPQSAPEAPLPIEHLLEERLQAKLVALVARNAPMSHAASVLNGAAVAYVMREYAPAQANVWFAALCVLTVARALLTIRYSRSQPTAAEARRWQTWFSVGILAHASVWSAAGALFFPVLTPGVRAFVALIQAGMVAGGVSTLAALRGPAIAWAVLLVLPVTYHSFTTGGALWTIFGLNTLLFLATEITAVFSAHERIVLSVRLALQNETLAASLSRSLQQLEETNAELEQARNQALAAAQSKADFLASMSHEIRTPMTAILGYADVLQHEPHGQDLPGQLNAIQRNAEHLLTIVNDILDFSKIDAGKMTVEEIHFCPGEVIGSAVEMLQQRADAARIAVGCELFPPFPRQLLSDPVRIRQIVLNLLSNAIKFTPGGQIAVEGLTERDGDQARMLIRVRDTGIGMSAEQLARLFQPFTQADKTTARNYGGTGLGLSISLRLAHLLRGELSVQSELGKGSCFQLSLPIGSWDALVCGPPERRLQPAARLRSHAPPQFRGRVLLAEDGADNRRLIRMLLERRGLEVAVATNGREAVDRALRAEQEGEPFDLILMDVQMPELDGASAAEELKRAACSSPIVALTAQSLPEDATTSLGKGFDGHESKPIVPQRFDQTLAAYLPSKPAPNP